MTPTQYIRYSRQIPSIGKLGQQRLLDARILIIGVGGLGSPAAMYLAAAGIGTLVLSDFDRVEESNLQRQIIHSSANIGESKVLSAKQTLAALNPECCVIAKAWQLENSELIDEINQADVVLDCSDNFTTRFAINRACVTANTALVSGAAINYAGQVITIIPQQTACYECLYPADTTAEFDTACDQIGIIAPLVGVIGSLQALHAIQIITGFATSVAGKLLLFDAATMQWRSITVPRDPVCLACGKAIT